MPEAENNLDNDVVISKAKWLFEQDCTFLMSVVSIKTLPEPSLPEVGFIGRSNVGKSSLINSITRKNIARSSVTPGRTQHLNFFNVAGKFLLVDMPGYGFAKAPRSIVANWQLLNKRYLIGRNTLKIVYVLIDSRHGIKKNDIEMMDTLEEFNVPYQIILTKADKISKSLLIDISNSVLEFMQNRLHCKNNLLITSSEKKIGIDEVRLSVYLSVF